MEHHAAVRLVTDPIGIDTACELTILMPCLNEARTIAGCVEEAIAYLRRAGICGEVLVADNCSEDGSGAIATRAGARVIDVQERGYGAALRAGIKAARGRFIIMGDADESYDFGDLDPFLAGLRDGADLVIGNRFKGGIAPGAMPVLHRYIGNPVLSFLSRLFFGVPVSDVHCGLRAFRKRAILDLDLLTSGMEYASEMVVKASLRKLKIVEVPTRLARDGRNRPPHLRTFGDGWRHLRFMLLYSPNWLFIYPGLILLLAGCLLMARLHFGALHLLGLTLDINTMLYSASAAALGLQVFLFGLVSKICAGGEQWADSKTARLLSRFSLELGALVGLGVFLLGFVYAAYTFYLWGRTGFSQLDPVKVLRDTIPAGAFMTMGVEIVATSFLYGLLKGA
ncbi:MAG TPA: glycosyltransferase family 2 protein [Methylovirgula sp.]|nr:glycosyltransferase family 2 protein [Methylovirgula sp.]